MYNYTNVKFLNYFGYIDNYFHFNGSVLHKDPWVCSQKKSKLHHDFAAYQSSDLLLPACPWL